MCGNDKTVFLFLKEVPEAGEKLFKHVLDKFKYFFVVNKVFAKFFSFCQVKEMHIQYRNLCSNWLKIYKDDRRNK